jgi:hypothetical protein
MTVLFICAAARYLIGGPTRLSESPSLPDAELSGNGHVPEQLVRPRV